MTRGKTVTGSMFEVTWHANKIELTAKFGKCSVFAKNGMFFRFFMWSEAVMLKLPCKETKMSKTDMPVLMWKYRTVHNPLRTTNRCSRRAANSELRAWLERVSRHTETHKKICQQK